MTKNFKLKYELNDVPSRSFITAVPVEATCSNFFADYECLKIAFIYAIR